MVRGGGGGGGGYAQRSTSSSPTGQRSEAVLLLLLTGAALPQSNASSLFSPPYLHDGVACGDAAPAGDGVLPARRRQLVDHQASDGPGLQARHKRGRGMRGSGLASAQETLPRRSRAASAGGTSHAPLEVMRCVEWVGSPWDSTSRSKSCNQGWRAGRWRSLQAATDRQRQWGELQGLRRRGGQAQQWRWRRQPQPTVCYDHEEQQQHGEGVGQHHGFAGVANHAEQAGCSRAEAGGGGGGGATNVRKG